MDRSAIAREERRRRVTEELETERDRAAQLREEIERIVAELEGPALDEEVFARMPPEDVELIRDVLQEGPAPEGLEEEDWLDDDGAGEGGDPEQRALEERREQEEEIERLQAEIAKSTRRQDALGHYLEALET